MAAPLSFLLLGSAASLAPSVALRSTQPPAPVCSLSWLAAARSSARFHWNVPCVHTQGPHTGRIEVVHKVGGMALSTGSGTRL